MSIAARTETAEQRSAIYASLMRRNRLVAILRIGLPAIGAVILLGLVLQIVIGSLVPDFGFADISIDRGNLVVEAPVYAGVGGDGSVYEVRAERAHTALGNTDLVYLSGVSFSLTQPSGTRFEAAADAAELRVPDQVVSVAGTTRVSSSNGLSGVVGDAVVDVRGERLVATGGADLAFGEAATIRADAMSYDGRTQVWRFTRAILEFSSTPGEEAYARGPASVPAPAAAAGPP